MRACKLFMIPALVALTLLAPAAPVLAAPGGSGNGATFPLVCDGLLSTLRVGGGPWSAAHIAESGETFVPVSTHFTMRDPETFELFLRGARLQRQAAEWSEPMRRRDHDRRGSDDVRRARQDAVKRVTGDPRNADLA